MPDYFVALVCQYSGAINSEQAERYARSFIAAWYFTLNKKDQDKLVSLLPDYLKPKKNNIFAASRKPKLNLAQSNIFISRIGADLAKTGDDECLQVISALMKSLKIISSHEQKFAYSNLLDSKLHEIFVRS